MATHRPQRLQEEAGTPARPEAPSAPAEAAHKRDNNGTIHLKVPILAPHGFDITIPRIPFQDELEQGMDFLDRKIPKIRGRPALRELLSNSRSGLTVSLVSLPLSISLAIAADATPVQGIITAAWAGIVSALTGGSHYNIVGPTGALSGILSYFSVTYGAGIQPLLAIMTGVLSLLVWVSRIDKYLVFIPGSVMHGFTLGVAFIISANQLNFLLGLPKLKRHPEFVANLYETLNNIGLTSSFAVGFFVVAFGSLFTLARRYGKIPWAVVLAIIGIAIGAVADATKSTLPLQTIRTQYGDLSLQLVRLSEIFTEGLDASLEIWLDLLRGAVSIAAVAVLETLISARIADRMTKTLFDQRQEVMSVALSNLASGFTGGIPATAALARTALNVKSGATSRASGIVNGVAIIILSTALFSAFKYLPLPVVAAILVNTAYRMIEFHEIEIMYKTDKPSFVVCCITGLICVVEDPTMGIVYGTFLAMIRLLLAMIHGHATLQIFKGTRSELLWVFDQNDRKSLKKVRAKFTKETDPEELAAAEKHAAAEKAAGLPSTFLLQAAHALRAASVKAAEKKIPEPEVMETGINPEGHYYTVASDRDVDSRLPKVAVYSLTGYFTYIAAQSHLDRIRGLFLEPNTRLPDVDVVAFSLVECYYADPDALDALGDVIGELTRANKSVFLLGFHTRVSRVLHKLPWFPRQVTFPDYGTLLLHLRDILRLDDEKRRTPAAADMSFADFVAEKTANGTLLSSLSPEFVHKTIGHTDASDSDTDDDGHANNPAVRAAAQRRASLAAATAAAATATPFHSSLGASAGAGVGLSPVQHSWSSPRGAATAAAAAAVPAMALAASTASDPAASHGAHAAAPAAAAASPASAAVAVPLHNTSDHEAVWSSTAVAAATETAATTSTTAAAAAPSPFDKEWQ